jgi:hypothetical protein
VEELQLGDPERLGPYRVTARLGSGGKGRCRAETIARSIGNLSRKESALYGIAGAMAAADPDRAEAIARSLTDTSLRVHLLATLVCTLAQ